MKFNNYLFSSVLLLAGCICFAIARVPSMCAIDGVLAVIMFVAGSRVK